MTARFFVDENDLALGRALHQAHSDVVYPGHPDLSGVPRGTLDDEWLPVVASLRLANKLGFVEIDHLWVAPP